MSLFVGLFVVGVVALPTAEAAAAATAKRCVPAAVELRACPDAPLIAAEHAGADDRRLPTPAAFAQAAPSALPSLLAVVLAAPPVARAATLRTAPLWALAPKTSPPRDRA